MDAYSDCHAHRDADCAGYAYSDRHADRYAVAHRNADGRSHHPRRINPNCNPVSGSNVERNAHRDSASLGDTDHAGAYVYVYVDGNGYTHGDRIRDAEPDRNAYADGNGYTHGDRVCHAEFDHNAHADGDGYTHGDCVRDAEFDHNAHADGDGDLDAYRNRNADSHSHGDCNADRYAHADPNPLPDTRRCPPGRRRGA